MKPFRSPSVCSVLIAVLLLAPALAAAAPIPHDGTSAVAGGAPSTLASFVTACEAGPADGASDLCRTLSMGITDWLTQQTGCDGVAPAALPAVGVGLSHLVDAVASARIEAAGVAAARLGIPFGFLATADAVVGLGREATTFEDALATWTSVVVEHASARDLVASLPLPEAASESNPPTRDTVLAFAALTAPPAAVDPSWYAGPAGLEWASLASERLAALTQEIAELEEEYPTRSNGWPGDEALAATATVREDRMLLAIATLYLAFHDANYDGNLLGVLNALGSVALLALFDAAVLLASGCAPAAVMLADDAAAVTQSLMLTLLPFSPRADPGFFQMLADVMTGTWYNTAAPAGLGAARAAEGVAGPAYDIIEGELGAAMRTESLDLYHGAYISSLVLAEGAARRLPRDANAVTDGPATTEWSVAIGGLEGSGAVTPAFSANSRVVVLDAEDAKSALAVALGTPDADVDADAAEAFLKLIGSVAGPHHRGGELPVALDSPLIEAMHHAIREAVTLPDHKVETPADIVRADLPDRDDINEAVQRVREAINEPVIDYPELPDRDDIMEAVQRVREAINEPVIDYPDLPDRDDINGAVTSLRDRADDRIEDVGEITASAREALDRILQSFHYSDNLELSLAETPAVYEENGRIYQITTQSYTLLLQDEREPGYIYDPGPQDPVGCWFNEGAQALIVAGTAVGFAAAVTAVTPAAPAAAPVAVVGAAYVLAGVALQYATRDSCDGTHVPHPGWYRESGVFTNAYGDFGWLGNGYSLLGNLASVYGTTSQPVLVPALKGYAYSNANDDTGHAHGLQSAEQARETARAFADLGLEEFQAVASPLGTAYLTIEILCQGADAITINAEWDTPLLNERGSGICIRVVVGSDSVGDLAAEGYGNVNHVSEGVDGTGWVEVNGQRALSPAVLDAEGSGVNCPGGGACG